MEQIINTIKSLDSEKTITLIIAATILIIWDICSPLFSYAIIKMFNFKKNSKEIKNNTFYTAIKNFFRISAIYVLIIFLKPTFNISNDFMELVTRAYKIIVTITIATSIANSITRKSKVVKKIKEKSDKDINDSATRILVRLMKVGIYFLAAFIIFIEIGYDLSGLITGLGLGSVVLTLAAQDTIKNLIGGIIILIDKPFKAGEMIKFATYQGKVEDMTLRSTRIRTLDDTIIQIPNSLIVSSSIENLSNYQRRRFVLNLELALDTKMEKINVFKERIYGILRENENVIQDTINIHFTEIESNGFNILITCYFNIPDYMEFLDLKEDLNKNIMKTVNQEKMEFAHNTKTIEMKNYI